MRVLSAIVILFWTAVAALAHHSTAPYDLIHGTIIEGIVSAFAWENPHAHIYLDVSGEDNAVEHWTVEIDSPGALRRLGWTEKTIKPGDRLTITGGRAKNGSFNLRGVYIQFPDGRRLMGLPGPNE